MTILVYFNDGTSRYISDVVEFESHGHGLIAVECVENYHNFACVTRVVFL